MKKKKKKRVFAVEWPITAVTILSLEINKTVRRPASAETQVNTNWWGN